MPSRLHRSKRGDGKGKVGKGQVVGFSQEELASHQMCEGKCVWEEICHVNRHWSQS